MDIHHHETASERVLHSAPRLVNSEPTGLLLGLAGEKDRTTAGSVSDYLPDHSDTGTLYAWKITRQETADPHSLTIRDDFCTLPRPRHAPRPLGGVSSVLGAGVRGSPL